MGIFSTFSRRAAAEDDCLQHTSELTVELPALKRPTLEELRKQYSWIKSIERDTSPEVPVTLKLATVLRPNETAISGTAYERRLALTPDAMLGYQHWQWLLEHQDEHPAFLALFGKVYIDFPGIVVLSDDGHRSVPYCLQVSARRYGHWSWLVSGFSADGRVAVVGK